MRGVRIFDISNIKEPKLVANVQTCRGSHTHTVLEDPKDRENVYIYVSGSSAPPERRLNAGVRARRADAARTRTPRACASRSSRCRSPIRRGGGGESRQHLRRPQAPPQHGPSDADKAEIAAAKARGAFTAFIAGHQPGDPELPSSVHEAVRPMLDSLMKARGGTTPNAADSGRSARPCRRA
jgi:hypothetical protein